MSPVVAAGDSAWAAAGFTVQLGVCLPGRAAAVLPVTGCLTGEEVRQVVAHARRATTGVQGRTEVAALPPISRTCPPILSGWGL